MLYLSFWSNSWSSSLSVVRNTVEDLKRSGVGWSEIFTTLNPSNDFRIAQLLQDIRGPHMFAPHTGLNVILSGIDEALFNIEHPSLLDALVLAKRTMETVTRFGEIIR